MIRSNRVAGAATSLSAADFSDDRQVSPVNDNGASPLYQRHRVAPGQPKLSFSVSERLCRQPSAGKPYNGQAKVEIDGRQIKITRQLQAGLPVTVKIQAKQYAGVGMRVAALGSGVTEIHLELVHSDPLLTVPLMISQSDMFLSSDWRAWANQLCLPMIAVEADGTLTALNQHVGAVELNGPVSRRKRSDLALRRPRFLSRRKVGGAVAAPAINGSEMIARQ